MHVEVASFVDCQDLLLSREADLWPWARVGHAQQMGAKSGLRLTTGWASEIALTISGEKQKSCSVGIIIKSSFLIIFGSDTAHLGLMAQLVARVLSMDEVRGSKPRESMEQHFCMF